MQKITKEIQGNKYVFDLCTKDEVQRRKPTVVVFLKKTNTENELKAAGVYRYDNPNVEFEYNPISAEVQKADYALVLNYDNKPDVEEDEKILKAAAHILFSYFQEDRIIRLDNGQSS